MQSEPSGGIKLTAYSCICWLFHRIYYDTRNHKHKILCHMVYIWESGQHNQYSDQPWAEWSGVQTLVEARYCLFSKTIQTGSSAHPASYSVSIWVLPSGLSGWDMMSTTNLHLVLRLRMSGAIPLLSLYTFMAWTGATLPLTLHCTFSWSL